MTDDIWQAWNVTRTPGSNTDRSTLRYGKDTKAEVGMFFQAVGYRPLRIATFVSPTDGGVVTHSLQWIDAEGAEHWSCDDDSSDRAKFDRMWQRAVIFPEDWKFEARDFQKGLNPAYLPKA